MRDRLVPGGLVNSSLRSALGSRRVNFQVYPNNNQSGFGSLRGTPLDISRCLEGESTPRLYACFTRRLCSHSQGPRANLTRRSTLGIGVAYSIAHIHRSACVNPISTVCTCVCVDIAFTRYWHCQYCIMYGMHTGSRVDVVFCAIVVQ